jgi:VWFA-related protein
MRVLMAVLLAGFLTASAQTTNDVLHVNVDLIQTPITVLDKSGHFVDGLTRDQFELMADGKRQPIASFERVLSVDSRSATLTVGDATPVVNRAADSGNRSRTPGRTIVFFVDDLHLSPESMNLTRQTLRRFLEKGMEQGDFVSVASASGQIGFLQQFTNNIEVLRSAIDRLNPRPYDVRGYGTGSTVMSEYLALDIENRKSDKKVLDAFVEECMQLTNSFQRSGGRATLRLQCETEVKASARMILMQAGSITRNTYFSFDALLRAAAARSGRKIAFFISDGFLMDVGPRGPALRELLDQIINSANRAGVVVNTIHAKGLNTGNVDPSIKQPVDANGRLESARTGEIAATQDALNGMAAATGGRALRNQNQFDQWIVDVLNETSNYYLLGWRPDTEEPGKLLKVKVTVLDKPDLIVRAPTAYLTSSSTANDSLANATSDDRLRSALAGNAPQTSLDIWLSLTYLNTPSNALVLTSWMEVASNSLLYGNDGNQPAALQIAGVILTDKGKVAKTFKTQLNVAPLKAETKTVSGITYAQPTPLSPGTYEVRVAALDSLSGRIGCAVEWLVLPDLTKHQLTLSSLLLNGRVVEANKEETPQVQLSVDHRFQRSGNLSYWAFVYNAKRDASGQAKIVVQTQILQNGQKMDAAQHKLVSASADASGIPFGENLSLKDLTPGRYELRVIATDEVAGNSASQSSPFEIQD